MYPELEEAPPVDTMMRLGCSGMPFNGNGDMEIN
jgi:hypothetical protein